MPATVAVVTDSTCSLPGDVISTQGITVIPVQVVVDGRSYAEGSEISSAEVAQALRSGAQVGTSRPAPAEFAEAYRRLAAAGYQEIVSVHLSAQLSSTVESARIAAKSSPVPVKVVDTQTVAMAAGFAVLDAAEAARLGHPASQVAAVAQQTALGSDLLFYVDTLEYLARGGRIGTAARYLGQALRVKPILHMEAGAVAALEKVRTANRALLRLAELATVSAQAKPGARIAVQELESAAAVAKVVAELAERLPGLRPTQCEVGAVIGAHTGPGVVAVAIAPECPL